MSVVAIANILSEAHGKDDMLSNINKVWELSPKIESENFFFNLGEFNKTHQHQVFGTQTVAQKKMIMSNSLHCITVTVESL